MKYYTVHCMDCMCILGISKKKTWDKEIRCMKCGKKEIKNQDKNAIAISDSNADLDVSSLNSGQNLDRNPQDESGSETSSAKDDTGHGTFPADLKSNIVDKIFPRIEELCGRVDNDNVPPAYMIAFEIGLRVEVHDALDSKNK